MKKKRSVRVKAEKGYGPRHAFNAQEGSEAVPSELPSVPEVAPDRATLAMREIIRQAREGIGMSPEQVAEIRRNPLGAKALASYAQAGIMLMPEFGGEKPTRPLDPGAMAFEKKYGIELYPKEEPQKPYDINKWQEQVGKGQGQYQEPPLDEKGIENTGGEIQSEQMNSQPNDDISHLKGQNWMDAYLKKLDDAGLLNQGPQAVQDALDALKEPPLEEPKTSKPPEEEPPVEPNASRYGKGAKRVGVAKGFGPAHAENSKEGEDLTQVNTDTVPAMLTPREAVLNRNAAELAGRGKIEALNAEGNQLARKGVDLAAGKAEIGKLKAENMKSKPKSSKPASSGSPYVQAFQKLMPKQPAGYEQGIGGVPSQTPPYSTSGGGRPSPVPQMPPSPQPRPQGGMPPAAMPPMYNSIGGGGRPAPAPMPAVRPMPLPAYAGGSAEVAQGPIGTPPQGEQAFGPPVQLSAPQIMAAAKQAGLSQGQLAGLMKAFQGGQQAYNSIGGGGTPDAASMFSDAGAGYQGGISDIGYPPFVAPSANYDGNRGGWLGPYDPSFMIQRYAGGISSVPFR
jgi:hypothetical protein